MKKLSLLASLLVLTASLTSCGAIAESIIGGIFSGDDDDETSYPESREKQERRSYYRTEGKPTLQ
ncbi:MAG: hypothetical protein ACSHYB_08305 [Roseibacillus sp.]